MNELQVIVNENQEQTVSGRELHTFLEVETRYNDWFARMLKYGFVEGADYILRNEYVHSGKREREYNQLDHIMKLDMAKELCMLARSDKGKKARQYFLQVEREWNSPEKVMARALQIANKQLAETKIQLNEAKATCEYQAQQIAEFKPIKEYVDTILASQDLLTASQIAADYGLSARALNKILFEEHLIHNVNGQWILYSKQMNKGYTKSETIVIDKDNGSQKTVMHTKWTQKGRLRIHELLTNRGIQANMDRTDE